jgi:C1A family cysteine protease
MKNAEAFRKTTALSAALSVLLAWAPPSYAHEDYPDDDFFDYEEFTFGFDTEMEYDNVLDEAVDRLFWGYEEDFETGLTDGFEDEDEEEELPKKFDLRDVDGVCYVPEIRDQSPFGTCWSFGAVAASEISIAYALGLDYNTMSDDEKKLLDLSEKHLAWFSYTSVSGDPIVYGSQIGEGYHIASLDDGIDSDEETYIPYDLGGFTHFASVLFSEGIGPALEVDVPYLNRDGKWEINISTMSVSEEWETTYGDNEIGDVAPDRDSIDAYIADFLRRNPGRRNYDTDFDGPGEYYSYSIYRSEKGDWSLDESQRFRGFFLKESNILPSPAKYTDYGYAYDEKATAAIKKELLSGKGVAVNFMADQSRPGDYIEHGDTYLNFLTEDGEPAGYSGNAAIWAHYTYDKSYDPDDPDSWNGCVSSNHAVCIVGYDDDFPKEYFNDPKGTIGGNGAWIVRNSWGCDNNSDITATGGWGNNGDGYFYISYYDQSLSEPESYEFDLFDPDAMGKELHIYDLFPSFSYTTATFDKPVYMANVFTADCREVIRDLGIMTALPELDAKLTVYLLDNDFKSPTDGKKVSETGDTFVHKGYHTARLENPVIVEKGQKYSVVLELKRADGKYVYEINNASNRAQYNSYSEVWKEDYIYEHGSLEGYEDPDPLYAQLIINEDESWLGVMDENQEEWKDLSKIRATFDEYNIKIFDVAGTDYDNFPIRSYPYSDQLHVENTVEKPDKIYDEGDVINGTITVTNVTSRLTYNDIFVSNPLTDLGKDAKIDVLAPGASRTINYSYTVTADDLEAGELTSAVNISCEGYEYSFLKEFVPETFVLKLAEKKPAATEAETSVPEISEEPAESGTHPDNTPVFILIIAVCAAVMIAAGIVTFVLLRKKPAENEAVESSDPDENREEGGTNE